MAGDRPIEASGNTRRGSHGSGAPSPWVTRYLSRVKPVGTVLDVACGGGRHLRLARQHGFSVVGVDRTCRGVADLDGLPGVELIEADLEDGRSWPLADRTFDIVIVTNYLWRPVFPDIVAAVSRSGLLLYETFAQGNERFGSPRNPDFLLAPGELIERTRSSLVTVAYEHSALAEPARHIARIAAVGADHDWLIDPPSAQF